MKKSLMLLMALSLSVPAGAQSLSEKTGMNALVGAAPTTADFVKIATVSDLFEIQSSELALQGQDHALNTFATTMIQDHKKTSADLKDIIASNNLPVTQPTAMDDSHQATLDKLKGLQGTSFTREYRKDQISGHEDAVSLFRRYSQDGDNPALKTWATQTLPRLEDHLKMAKALPH
ncbi:DUF4142 domain-containing protein [Acetobacter sp. TBRC 12305]|uniref:DUF4142 domain-containing protein n=1 Tax=Acetobacter garciniae TaxID=2817435 RepID=A0A939KR22_9PROT|nr:DUF4142 domain-containing protein [Acetobacter garciniae]MBO1324476.1 DUF4142 domain-containing protein [Acetobacter garciniae]MBX0344165.1 DUF4142 domain-containing protein [Acetobacter garciniae]